MIEPEIAFADLSDDMNLAEDYLNYCVKFVLENCADDLEFFENNSHGEAGLRDRLRNVLDNEFKVRFSEKSEEVVFTRHDELLSMGISPKRLCRETIVFFNYRNE
jgi:aspartyl/asparaginyl-tRNA synthetase